jgi:hypothetical protein
MLRTALLSWYLISVSCALLATPVRAEEGHDCSHFSWDVSHELKIMKQTAVSLAAATQPGTQVPVVKIDTLYELKLSPQSTVTYSVRPAKPTLNDSAQGGLVRFHTGRAGLYRVSITSGHWIDLVAGQQLLKSKDFSGSRECARPHKIVEFELPANQELVLQFSGSTDTSVITAITPVATPSPN